MPPEDHTDPTNTDHLEWIRTAKKQLEDEDDIYTLFQAIGYDGSMNFLMTEHPAVDPIGEHFELLAAHLAAFAAATGAPVEHIAADAVSTFHGLNQEGVWDGLDIPQSDTPEEPFLCSDCNHLNQSLSPEAPTQTTFTQTNNNTWVCDNCGHEE